MEIEIPSASRRARHGISCAAVAALAMAAGAGRAPAQQTSATWLNPTSGNWTDAANWSTAPDYPNNDSPAGAEYDAVIAATGAAYTVSYAGFASVDSLTLNSADATLAQTGGSLTVLNGVTLTAGTYRLANGTLYTSLLGGPGTFTFDGNNTFAQSLQPAAGGTLTIAADVTVRTLYGTGTIGGASGSVINNGTIVAEAGHGVKLAGPFTNNGTLKVDGATITFSGALATASLGTIVNTGAAGSAVVLDGSLDNNGATLALSSTTGPLALSYATTITGGTISGSGTGTVRVPVSTPTVDGVTVAGTGISVLGSGTLLVKNGLTLSNGTVAVGAAGDNFTGTLKFDGAQTLAGTGEISMKGRGLIKPSGGALTLAAGVTVRANGVYNQLGDSALPLTNQGTVTVEGTNGNFDVLASTFTNAGTVNTGAGNNTIANFQNTGTLNVSGSTSSTLLSGTWHNGGTINLTAGRLDLGGTFGLGDVGTLTHTGGTVNVAGTLDAAGGTLALTATTGSWQLGNSGRIKNATLTTAGGAALNFVGQTFNPGGTLDNVTAGADLTVPYGAAVTVENGLTLNNHSVTVAGTGTTYATKLLFNGTQTLGGTGEILLSGPYGTVAGTSGTLTIGPNVTIRSTGTSGGGTIGAADYLPLVNQGTISSEVSGTTISLRGSSITNTGTIRSTAGAYLSIYNLQNQGTVTAAGQVFTLGGTSWHNAGTITTSAQQTYLGGAFGPGDLGNFNRTGGKLILLGQFDNTGNSLDLAAKFNGAVTLMGAITGGTVVPSATAPLTINGGGTLDTVTLDGDVTSAGSGTWYVKNGFTVPAGRKLVFTGGEQLNAQNDATLSGGGEIDFPVAQCNLNPVGSTLTIGSGLTVKTTGTSGGGIIGNGDFPNAGAVVNSGTLWVNSPGGYLSLVGAFTNNGVIRIDSGKLNLGGTDSLGNWGTIQRNGGAVNFIGILNNQGKTLDLSNTAVGPINIGSGAGITGGTITAGGPDVPQIVRSSPTSTDAASLVGITLATSLNIQAVPVWISGPLTLSGGPNVRVIGNGAFTVFHNGGIYGDGTISFENGTVNNLSINTLSDALTIGPGVTVRTVSGRGNISTGGLFTNQGTLSAQASGQLFFISGPFTNQGTVEARGGGNLTVSATPTNLVNNTLTGGTWAAYAGSTVSLAKTFTTNAATVTLDGAGSVFAAVAPLASNSGTFEIDHGRNFATVGALANSGTLRVGTGSTLTVNGTFTNTGKIKGKGTIAAASVQSSGTIAPGDSPGELHVDGNLTLLTASTVEIEVGGTTPGVDYDVLDVTGTAALDGALQIVFVNGFTPTAGEQFTFFNLAHTTGQFASVAMPDLPPGVTWDVNALKTGGSVGVPEPAGVAILVIAAAALQRRRRHRTALL